MNYENIGRAVQFYGDRGYVYLDDAPWMVGKEAYYATKPFGAVDMVMDHQGLDGSIRHERRYAVASGEQSFLQMMMDGQPIKRAICVTPCYRYEPRVDMLHRRYFVKAELINAQDVDMGHLLHMVHDACSFFEQFFSVRIQQVGDSFDIVEKSTKFELGSYGIRERDLLGQRYRWIYGTGCAEPRLSSAIEKHSKHAGR